LVSQVFQKLRRQVVGIDHQVPLATGGSAQYVFLDNAASTPTLKPVLDKVQRTLEWYSSIHRGTGYKSNVATEYYEQARRKMLDFVGGNKKTHEVVFAGNTTEAINRLACCLPLPENPAILISPMEHHSNELPWRRFGEVHYLPLAAGGRIDIEAAEKMIASLADRLALVALTGASNITGQFNPIHTLARATHRHGARVIIDAAQLAPHCAINIEGSTPGEHLDFIAIAGHKMYAPFGGAALIGRRDALADCRPACVGGGTVKLVTRDRVVWADLPSLLEAGTPNVVGAVSMAAAAELLLEVGFEAVREHEIELTRQLLEGLRSIPGLTIYGPADPAKAGERLGVVAFNLEGYPHNLTAAVLSYEYGIGVRNGCFCAHPFVVDLLRIDESDYERRAAAMLAGDRGEIPGMVRVSLGIYNTAEEVDRFLDALRRLAAEGPGVEYELDRPSGAYHPRGFSFEIERLFSINGSGDHTALTEATGDRTLGA
jgi:cysteine desulfurase / selenocysteine lyase